MIFCNLINRPRRYFEDGKKVIPKRRVAGKRSKRSWRTISWKKRHWSLKLNPKLDLLQLIFSGCREKRRRTFEKIAREARDDEESSYRRETSPSNRSRRRSLSLPQSRDSIVTSSHVYRFIQCTLELWNHIKLKESNLSGTMWSNRQNSVTTAHQAEAASLLTVWDSAKLFR